MVIIAIMSWLKNSYRDGKKVEANSISPPEFFFMIFLVVAVTVDFYFIPKFCDNDSLFESLSVIYAGGCSFRLLMS